MAEKKASKAASPPADAPMPTMGKLTLCGTAPSAPAKAGDGGEAGFDRAGFGRGAERVPFGFGIAHVPSLVPQRNGQWTRRGWAPNRRIPDGQGEHIPCRWRGA